MSESALPSRPDFEAIEAVSHKSANRRTEILALIGNLVYSWSNNESMFIYVIMLLLNTDQAAATIVFASLNTTRARLDLVQRLASARITNRILAKRLSEGRPGDGIITTETVGTKSTGEVFLSFVRSFLVPTREKGEPLEEKARY